MAARRMSRWAWLLLAVVAVGCNRGGQIPTYPVSGKVVFPDGHPLEGGSIIFESQEHGLSARSVINPDGTFKLGTYRQGDGAVAGEHRVAVVPPVNMEIDRDQSRPPPIIHPKYSDIEVSGLDCTVEPKKRGNRFTFTVDRA